MTTFEAFTPHELDLGQPPLAVLFDRDDTLIVDVPYNGDPSAVRLIPGAREAVEQLRQTELRLGVVSNQSGIARGLITAAEVQQVNDRVEELLGIFDTWQVCPHDERAYCACRKPQPGLVLAAAIELGVAPDRCIVIGDIGADMVAARTAGAHGILVPTPRTEPLEIDEAPVVAETLGEAIHMVLASVAA